MKKKRKDSKKNGSNSHSGINGSDSANCFPNDKHHNNSTPCSNLTAAIAREIFPTAAQPAGNDGADNNGKKDTAAANKDVGRVNGKRRAAGKKSKEDKSTGSAEEDGASSSTKTEEQPLLGFMIQRYLVEEREKTRGVSISNSKKKKNKKKRKKKATAALSIGGAGGQEDVNNNEVGGKVGDENDSQAAGAAAMTKTLLKESLASGDGKENFFDNAESSSEDIVKKTLKLSSCLPSFEPSVSPQSSPRDGGKGEKPLTGLDRLLDSLIDSKDAPSTTSSQSTKRGDRDMEAFSAFLTRKLKSHFEQQQQSQQKNVKSNNNKAASTSPGSVENVKPCRGMEFKDVLPTISINDAHELATAVDCRMCRTSATCHLRSLIREEPFLVAADAGIEIEYQPAVKNPLIILNEESAKLQPPSSGDGNSSNTKGYGYSLSIPKSGRFSDGVENAFDYMSMDDVDLEAGGQRKSVNETSTTPSFHLELRPISQASEKVRFLQMGTVSEGGDMHEYPMNTQDIINLVRFILLPCGLEQSLARGEDAGDTPDDPSVKAMSDIAKQGFESLGKVQAELLKAKMVVFDMKEGMEQAKDCNNRSLFDVKTVKILNDSDASCELLLKQLGRLILRLLKSVCFVAWSSEHGLAMLDFFIQLWEKYTETFVSLVGPVMKHRGRLLAAADRTGAVPQAYRNKLARDSLAELVNTKITTLDGLMEDLDQLTKGQSNAPSPMVQLFVVEAYRQHFEPQKSTDDVFPSQEVEDLFTQLITAQIELSQKAAIGSSTEKARKKAKEHRVEMASLSRKIRKVTIAMEDFAPRTKVDFLVTAYTNFESNWYDLEKDQRELERDTASVVDRVEGGYEVKELSLLLQRSGVLVSQWLILLCARQCHESSIKSLSLPPLLKTWLDGISGTEMPKSMPGDEIIKQQCMGDGGERRVSSILASLLYRWLEARCSEWHAELTRDELLRSMDMEEPAVVMREGGGKSGKKKKSKRNKGKNFKNEPQAHGITTGTSDEKPVVDESGPDAAPGGSTYPDFEISQDEKKDDPIEIGAHDEILTLEAESIKLARSLAAMEEIGMEVATVSEVEWKQKKSIHKSGGCNKKQTKEENKQSRNAARESPISEKSKFGEKPAVEVALVEIEDIAVQEDGHTGSQRSDNEDSNGGTTEDPEKERPSAVADESLSRQVDGLKDIDNPPQEEVDNMICEYQPCVGIIDGKKNLTAEFFLVKRLQVIVGLENMDFAPNTKNEPVVWM